MVIHHTFGPHITWQYLLQASGMLFVPWKWKKGKSTELLRKELEDRLSGTAHLFASGREGLLALFRSMQLESGAEIIIQGYTCVAVSNAITAAGYTPVYADIDPQTLNIDPASVEQRLTPRTRAVVCQHTFGIPSNTEQLARICKKRNIVLIEDCAHVMSDYIGKNSRFLMFSFGRDKALSGITGGAIISRDSAVSARLTEEEKQAEDLSGWTIRRLLLYPKIYFRARAFWWTGLSKGLLKLYATIKFLIPVLTPDEKKGNQSPLLKRLPNACAYLVLYELRNLKKINEHRAALTSYYLEQAKKKVWKYPSQIRADLPLQKFPIYVENADALRAKLKKHSIYLDDGWTGATVCPRSVDQAAANYEQGSCPNAEEVARTVVTLPTHPTMTMKQAKKMISKIATLK